MTEEKKKKKKATVAIVSMAQTKKTLSVSLSVLVCESTVHNGRFVNFTSILL